MPDRSKDAIKVLGSRAVFEKALIHTTTTRTKTGSKTVGSGHSRGLLFIAKRKVLRCPYQDDLAEERKSRGNVPAYSFLPRLPNVERKVCQGLLVSSEWETNLLLLTHETKSSLRYTQK